MINRRHLSAWLCLALLPGCNLAPDFLLPDAHAPKAFKEAEVDPKAVVEKGSWAPAVPLEKNDRGQWWKIFGDKTLDDLEQQAATANPSLKAAFSRVDESRALARANRFSFLPDIDVGANAVRAKQSAASLQAFGVPTATTKPYTLYSVNGTASYEFDLFGRVRNNYSAALFDAEAEAAAYRSVLLALQADVAQVYFALREQDAERKLLRDTIAVRVEAARIMQKRFDAGDVNGLDHARTQSELDSARADLIALERQRAALEHGLAVLLGKAPAEYSFAEAPLATVPPAIPAGLPSALLTRRPDVAAAVASMQAANARIGVARAAFFPSLSLSATGGFESGKASDLFKWSTRSWALGQLAGNALNLPIFHNGRDFAQLDLSKSAYEESLNNYRTQVLAAFKDTEDALSDQRLLAAQSREQDAAATASQKATDLSRERYQGGEVNYFEVVDAQRVSLAANRAALQTRGQRFQATIGLIRALGGGWEPVGPSKP